MKKCILLAIIVVIFFRYPSYGQNQVNSYCFVSLEYESLGLRLKDRVARGVGLSLDINPVLGVGLQSKYKELCVLSRANNSITYFNTLSGEFYIHDDVSISQRLSIYPKVGCMVGIGTPIKQNGEAKSVARIKKDDLKLRDEYYFGGILIEIDLKAKLSSRFSGAISLRNEGLGGLITERSVNAENCYSFGSVSLGFKLFYEFNKEIKIPSVY